MSKDSNSIQVRIEIDVPVDAVTTVANVIARLIEIDETRRQERRDREAAERAV